MKKLLMYFCIGTLSASVFAQSNSEDRLPKAGDFGLGIDGVPIIDYVLDKTRIFSDVAPSSAGGLFSFYNPLTINGKYMITDNSAYRASVLLGYGSETQKVFVNKIGGNSGEKVEDATRTSNFVMSITAGKQFYKGNRNLRGFYGYDGIFEITRLNRMKYTYGNELSANNTAQRVVSSNNGTKLSLGARAFVGAEYYFVKNVSLSAELGYSIVYSRNGGNSSTSEQFKGGSVESETTEGAGSSDFMMMADATNSKLMLNFYF